MKAKTVTEERFDTIIIGSGSGGLAAAICLARAGQRVLVLEQHDVPGGWCHSFYLNGHRFSPGVHYIGLLEDGQSSSELYKGLGIADDLVFFQMNPDAYEHCFIGEERIDLPASFGRLKQSLMERFPHESEGIDTYLELVKTVVYELGLTQKVDGLWETLTIPFRTKQFGKHALFSLKKIIDRYIDDPLVKCVLNIQFGDHGVTPARASFLLHSAVMAHYFEGGYYPMGGGAGIVKAMTNAFKKHGGELRTRQTVSKILIEGGRKKQATGVMLETGQKIFADRVISNADPTTTYLDLVGRENLKSKMLRKLNKAKYSCTSLMLFLTVDMDVRAAGLDSGNIWMMRSADIDGLADEMLRDDIENGEEFPGMFVSCTTLKDPVSFDGRYHSIEAITYIDYTAFERYTDEDLERSEEYLEFKEKLTQKMLNTLEKCLPGVCDHIVDQHLGTPITNEYYINSTKGSVYGTEKSLKHIGPFAFKAKSPIKNLYLCGASIHAHGVAGAAFSGVQTAGAILGMKQDELLAHDGSQHIRIFKAEDPIDRPDWMITKMKVRSDRREGAEKAVVG